MVGRAVTVGRRVRRPAAASLSRSGAPSTAGRAVGRTVGEGSPAASARNRSALVAAMLTRSSNRCVQRPQLRGTLGEKGCCTLRDQ